MIIPITIAAYEEARRFDEAEAWRRKWIAIPEERWPGRYAVIR